MRAIALLALCVAAVSAVPAHPQRIIGGSVTTISQYPSMAALLYSANLVSYWQSCGGSIITNRAILTAAHCTIGDPANRWRARIGSTNASSGGTLLNIGTIINHPSYNPSILDNDIAILRTPSTFSLGGNIQSVSIAGSNYNLGDNQVVWAAGWGRTAVNGPASEQLRHVQVWTVNQATCRNRYDTIGWAVTDNMLCSGWLDIGGRDQCDGDSGGPLYHNGVVVGVCSWGLQCALAYYPGVNARVSRYTSWIQNNS